MLPSLLPLPFRKITFLTCLVAFLSVGSVSAQEEVEADTLSGASSAGTIAIKDAKEISYQAEVVIDGLQRLLNYIAFDDNMASELEEVIQSSYTPSPHHLFFNKDIIVESDIDPDSGLGNAQDISVLTYLNNFDLKYEKAPDATVVFTNIELSGIKKKDYIYMNAKFTAEYGSRNKESGKEYQPRDRQALIRFDNDGTKWAAFVMSISFYDPESPIGSPDGNLEIITDGETDAGVVSTADFEREKQSFIRARQQEQKRQKEIYDEYVNMGNSYMGNKLYKEALETYRKAKDLQPLTPAIDRKILDAEKALEEYTFSNYKNKGDKARVERNFNDAIQYYRQAILLKPEASPDLQRQINELTALLAQISLPRNKLQANDLVGAIEECERVLRDNKKRKNEFPELFFIQAEAYVKMAEKDPKDSRSREKALENYNLAIEYSTNYKEARLARAAYYVRFGNDIVSAITDYDVLETNELDDSPDKPLYFIAKARLKDKVKNVAGALADYDKAIALAPTSSIAYFEKGELLYRQKRYDEAVTSLSRATDIDAGYAQAFYYRGLAYVALDKTVDAGRDFTTAIEKGIDESAKEKIRAISQDYFQKGLALATEKKDQHADRTYNKALDIQNCNADALHGKAELVFRSAQMGASPDVEYIKAIALYDRALACNPNFSDAYFKKGLAQTRIEQVSDAVLSFTAAVTANDKNHDALFERGNAYVQLKDFAKAVESYASAAGLLKVLVAQAKDQSNKILTRTLEDALSRSYSAMSSAQYQLSQYQAAVQSASLAIELSEIAHEAFYNRGQAYLSLNELSKARKDFEQSIKLRPMSRYYYGLGLAHFRDEDYADAVMAFSATIASDTEHTLPHAYFWRGLSSYKQKSVDPAIKDFAAYEGLSVDTLPEFQGYYAFALLFASQKEKALQVFQSGLAKSQNDALSFYGLGCYHAVTGNDTSAFENFEKAFSLNKLNKDDLRWAEDDLLKNFIKVKENKTRYADLKKKYLKS